MFYDNYLFAVLPEMERATWHSQLHGSPNAQTPLEIALPTEYPFYAMQCTCTTPNKPLEIPLESSQKTSAVTPNLKTYTDIKTLQMPL